MSRLRTQVARARGLGSAQEGTHHWWLQRLTAIALVPLCIWFVAALVGLTGAPHAEVAAWIGAPVNVVLLVLFVALLFWHSMLGIQVVIEDYVHSGWLKLATLVALKLAHALLAIAAIYAVLRIGLGSQ